MQDTLEFYNHILSITKLAVPKKCREVLNRDADTVTDLIMKNFKENIEVAAMHGRTMAYLCVYNVSARYQNNIPVDYFIHMTDKIRTKFEEYGLEPVELRLQQKLSPFHLRICKLSEAEEFVYLVEHELFQNTATKMVVISVSWS